jgi:branched-chain amino acid transport system permease protein
VITGGKGTLAGPVVGSIIFGIFPEILRALAIKPEVQWIVYGILMILILYFLPDGIAPALRNWAQRQQEARAGAGGSPSPASVSGKEGP